MPRNVLLSRNGQPGTGPSFTQSQPLPAIRFMPATPSTHNVTEPQIDINMSAYPLPINPVAPFTASPLAPRTDAGTSPRKRLVPKKSKLSLLSASAKSLGKDKLKAKSKGKADDLSDVVRRVGAGSSRAGGFEIYVDHFEEEEDASMVVVKKKKSRAKLDNVGWGQGALGEVTNAGSNNVPPLPNENKTNNLKVPKGDENQNSKWWSIRGRKDGKNKENGSVRSKTPEPFSKVSTEPEPRARFNSLDSSRLLGVSGLTTAPEAPPQAPPKDVPFPRAQRQRSGTLSSLSTLLAVSGSEPSNEGYLAPPTPIEQGTNQGSIALRAMRSMRSLARMKSWANLGSDKTVTQEGNTVPMPTITNTPTLTKPVTTATTKTKKKAKDKEGKKKKDEKARTQTLSTSSFEAGALSSAPQSTPPPPIATANTINKKPSMLALGGLLPSTLRLGTMRPAGSRASSTASTASTASRLSTPVLPPPPPTTLYGLPNNRLSVESSAHLVIGANGRPSSAYSLSSQGTSLRPASTASVFSVMSRTSSGMSASAFSTRSGRSSSSSVASVRWDEEGLAGVKERQRRERERRKEERRSNPDAKESRRSADSRRRTAITEIFPEVRSASENKRVSLESSASSVKNPPILTVEEASTDGHGDCDSAGSVTPMKRMKPRPMSDGIPGKCRPKAFSNDAEGVISILDQATNELASLINRLDLEATPASVQGTPLQPLRESPSIASLGRAGQDSPLKGRKYTFKNGREASMFLDNRDSTTSIASLRTFAQAQSKPTPAPSTRQQAMNSLEARRMMIGQQIVPWSELDWQVSPKKPTPTNSTFRLGHRRTVTPTPEIDLGPAFQPLRPAAPDKVASVEAAPSASATPVPAHDREMQVPSSQTFGSSSRVVKLGKSASQDLGYDDAAPPSPTPPSKRAAKHARRPSVLSVLCDTGVALRPEAMKSLGLSGTLGGPEPEIDPNSPDSDIPDELQAILSGQSDDDTTQTFDDTLDFGPRSHAPSPGLPPLAALPAVQPEPKDVESMKEQAPVFRASLYDENANEADIDEGEGSSHEDDTVKSFDFTGELKRLSESGGSDRRSFVEQLESAFRTPVGVELGINIGTNLFKSDDAPLAALSLMHRETPDKDTVPYSVTSPDMSSINLEPSVEQFEVSMEQSIEQSAQESFRDSATSDTLEHLLAECEEDICRHYPEMRRSQSSMRSKESDGKLNAAFKFGGRPSIPESVDESAEDKPRTLSDIIPPLSHTRRHSRSSSILDEDSVLKSILGNAYQDDTSVVNSIAAHAQAAAPRSRVNSGASSNNFEFGSANSKASSHSRNNSELSFQGFETFDEVRRGFEFHPNRPAFYPPPGTTSTRVWHNKHQSFCSIASVSSFGEVVNSGASDPFGYRDTSSRPTSYADSISMSLTVDDTFSFLKKDTRRKRVDSDASDFYFRPGARRGHRRNESNFSVASGAPPISLYNRGFGGHRRNGSDASMSSIAQSYAMHGARASWARHRQEPSSDSIYGDFSPAHVARPGLGDKMFDMMDYGMPLASITASPTGSMFSEQQEVSAPSNNRTNYDSIFDAEPGKTTVEDSIFSKPGKTPVEDSIFSKTGYKTSYEASDDVFEFDLSQPQQDSYMRMRQFRPISMMSTGSVHSLAKDEDTMITMLGGGHVRRRSVDSCIDNSPSVPLERERKKHTALQHLARVLQFDHGVDELPASVPDRMSKISPEKMIVPKPSIASTSSYCFGSERMIVTSKGLLESQSLEESALMASKGLLESQSLEESALMTHSEDLLTSFENSRVFSRPGRATRSRSSTVMSTGSGAETPPLSASDSSSVSSGSQSSIDISHLTNLLTSPLYSNSTIGRTRSVRPRARGTGHRRRISQARASRSSVYETIQEESDVLSNSPSPEKSANSEKDLTQHYLSQHDSVYIVDPESASMTGDWDDGNGIVSLRKYFALRDEADETVAESKKVWIDTPFSVFAMQSFEPPASCSGMAAMLEQSQKTYGPLPSELRQYRVRSRTSSRASPYPVRQRRSSNEQPTPVFSARKPFTSPTPHKSSNPLRSISINPNISNPNLSVPEASNPGVKVFSLPPAAPVKTSPPFAVHVDAEKSAKKSAAKGGNGSSRQRVTSSARRTALGWSKKNTGKDNAVKSNAAKTAAVKTSTGSEKENSIGQGTMFTPNDSLRISRPRPKGRPTLARTLRAA